MWLTPVNTPEQMAFQVEGSQSQENDKVFDIPLAMIDGR